MQIMSDGRMERWTDGVRVAVGKRDAKLHLNTYVVQIQLKEQSECRRMSSRILNNFKISL